MTLSQQIITIALCIAGVLYPTPNSRKTTFFIKVPKIFFKPLATIKSYAFNLVFHCNF